MCYLAISGTSYKVPGRRRAVEEEKLMEEESRWAPQLCVDLGGGLDREP